LSEQERIAAVQRLDCIMGIYVECGLGGVLHALQMPFTGLLVGGLAVIIITFIAQVSGKKYKQF
jgi:tetrahydromethanopterin S-methyltransferase subunit C